MDERQKSYSPAYERNREPIAAVLDQLVFDGASVLEVGSGSGQHAVDFARRFATAGWQPTDRPGGLDSIRSWRDDAALANLAPPLALDLTQSQSWPAGPFDLVVAINVIHIAPWPATAQLFRLAAQVCEVGGRIFLYGPFRYRDRPFEPSNAAFDAQLRSNGSESGIRCYQDVDECARQAGFEAQGDQTMPANNRALWWRKSSA